MKKTFPLLLSVGITLLFSSNVLAQSSQSFEDWLEHYGAWDKLEREYAKEDNNDSPAAILKRAKVYLNLNSPHEALELIEMTTPFSDNATEIDRLWIGGQAYRAQGDLTKAVLWFSQSTMYQQNDREMIRRFKGEPGLEMIWKDVWLKLYWTYQANNTISRESQRDALTRILAVGKKVWGDEFWQYGKQALEDRLPGFQQTAQPPDSNTTPQQPIVTQNDSQTIGSALAAVSLEKFNEARSILSDVSNPVVQMFWLSIVDFIETGTLPATFTPYDSENYVKAAAFWKGNMLAPYSVQRSHWFIGNPDSGPWTQFRNNLLAMPVEEAAKAIDVELSSMLISDQTAVLLKNFKLALAMYNGDFISSARTWNSISKKDLSLSLKIAGTILFKDDLNNVLPTTPGQAFVAFPVIESLCAAAGYDTDTTTQSRFWVAIPEKEIEKASESTWPLDRLLRLAHWHDSFEEKPTPSLAKRAAYLFKDTAFGADSLLFLADQNVQSKNLQLAAFYLNAIREQELDPQRRMNWLDAKARLELDSGRPDTALKTYQTMTRLGQEIPVMTRLRFALLYQQRRQFKEARSELLTMWENRSSMATELQAETLFWLGEGEQATRNSEKALDYYLLLAWQYPQENIWALTAMYRASLIYEKRGKYETAKRLLKTVVKRADRKEQREAAKARIDAINKKTDQGSARSALVYPF